jgi:hypothetical protein
VVHGDTGPHRGEPTSTLAINWPLCAVTARNGPFEMAIGGGTHRRPDTEARHAIESGEASSRFSRTVASEIEAPDMLVNLVFWCG